MPASGASTKRSFREAFRWVAVACIFLLAPLVKVVTRWKWRYLVTGVALLALSAAGLVYWRASQALRTATRELQSSQNLRFITRSLPPVVSKFSWNSSPAAFTGAAVFRGELFVCGASGLFEYSSRGVLLKHYRPGQELPPSPLLEMMTGILKDAKDRELLIISANDGVLAFNGASFRQILPMDIDARSVTSVLPLASGQLLIGTRKRGVLVYDGEKLRAFHPTLTSLHVTKLAGDEGDLWIGTQDQGVTHWVAGRTESFSEAQGMPDSQVFSLAMMNGKTYAGTAVGIAEFDGGRFVRVIVPGFFARALYAKGSSLLASGIGEGIAEISLEPKRVYASLRPASPAAIENVQQILGDGNVLYAVTPNAVYLREAQRGGWHRVLSQDDTLLADRNISSLALDSTNHLWVGYFDRGLDLFEPQMKSVSHLEDENVYCINRILPNGANGAVAVATANGLVLFDQLGKKQQVLGKAEGLLADHITDAALYGSGMVLATPAGLTFLDASGPHSLYAFHGLVNNHVYAVAASGKEVIAGTLGGISILQNESVAANYTVATHGLTHNWISAVVRVGNDWIVGTYGGGIVRLLANGRFEAFDVATGKFEVYPNAMAATDHHILAGTLGKGLYSYNRDSNRWSVITEGLPSLTVTALAAGSGYIYVGTDNGLVHILEQDLP